MTIICEPPQRIFWHMVVSAPFGLFGAALLLGALARLLAFVQAEPVTRQTLRAPALSELAVWAILLVLMVVLVGTLGYCLYCAWQLLMLPVVLAFGRSEQAWISKRWRTVRKTQRPFQRITTLHFSLELPATNGTRRASFGFESPHGEALLAFDRAEALAVRRLQLPPALYIDWERSARGGAPS